MPPLCQDLARIVPKGVLPMSRSKASKGAGFDLGGIVGGLTLFGLLLLIAHAMVIAEDVKAVVEDPKQQNKPAEVLKLAVDLSRYLPK